MFYEVKVFDSQGQLKKVVSSKKLSDRFWRNNDTTPSYYEEDSSKQEEGNINSRKVLLDSSL